MRQLRSTLIEIMKRLFQKVERHGLALQTLENFHLGIGQTWKIHWFKGYPEFILTSLIMNLSQRILNMSKCVSVMYL